MDIDFTEQALVYIVPIAPGFVLILTGRGSGVTAETFGDYLIETTKDPNPKLVEKN